MTYNVFSGTLNLTQPTTFNTRRIADSDGGKAGVILLNPYRIWTFTVLLWTYLTWLLTQQIIHHR